MGPVEGLSTLPQDLSGLLAALISTGKFPKMENGTWTTHGGSGAPWAFGNNIVVPEGTRPEFVKHEQRHVGQSKALGPMFIPFTLAEKLHALFSGNNDLKNALERDAYAHQNGGEFGTSPLEQLLRERLGP